jgi:plastocyanin
MKRYAFLFLLVPAVVLAAGCGSSKSSSPGGSGSTVPTTPTHSASSKGTMDVSGMSSVTLQMHNYFFSPKVLKGTASQKITVTLMNKGSVEHNFSVAGQHVNVNVAPGKTATAQVTFPKSGSVVFFCKIHRSLGMTGLLKAPGSRMSTTTTTNNTTTSGGGGYGY